MVITVSQSTLTNNLSPELYLHMFMHKLGKQCIVVKQLSDGAIALGNVCNIYVVFVFYEINLKKWKV